MKGMRISTEKKKRKIVNLRGKETAIIKKKYAYNLRKSMY